MLRAYSAVTSPTSGVFFVFWLKALKHPICGAGHLADVAVVYCNPIY